MREKGFQTIEDFRGLSLDKVTDWKHLDLNYKIVARIHEELCIGCQLCYTACWDGAHQCIHLDRTTGPIDGPVELHPTPSAHEAGTRASISVTPLPKLDPPLPPEPFRAPLSRIPRVDETECVGCNLCSLVCPVEHCITMVEVDTGLPPQSWEERSAGAYNQMMELP
jgi:dihydropyrimidine dehydrogenase (NAD+) subunit PreA